MLFLVNLWYVRSFSWTLEHYLKTVRSFEAQIAVRATLHNIGKPLFQDYTFQGKIIGFGFRLLRILFGLFFYGLIAILTCLAYIFWLLLPLLCVMSILGFFLAGMHTGTSGIQP